MQVSADELGALQALRSLRGNNIAGSPRSHPARRKEFPAALTPNTSACSQQQTNGCRQAAAAGSGNITRQRALPATDRSLSDTIAASLAMPAPYLASVTLQEQQKQQQQQQRHKSERQGQAPGSTQETEVSKGR